MSDQQKVFVKISLDKEKLTAVRTFLARKNLKIEDEFEQFFDTLFKKHVPKDVQIYIKSLAPASKKVSKKSPIPTLEASKIPAENPGGTEEKNSRAGTKTAEENTDAAAENTYKPPLPYDRFDRNSE